jgi:putative ABC transport system permease protein
VIDSFTRDIRFAWRLLAAHRAWTLAAILCLTIATGANTAAFSVVNALILRPLPFDDPTQLVMVALKEPERTDTRPFSLADYRDVAARLDRSVALLARTFLPVALAAADEAQMVEAELVSGNYFEVLRVAPHAGTFPDVRWDRDGAPVTAVISYALWQRRFAGDPAIVGRSVRLNGRPCTIVSVAPRGFVGATRLIASDLWLPASLYPTLARSADADRVPMFGIMGRMEAGRTRDEVRARLETIVAAVWRDRGVPRPPAVVVHEATGFGVPPVARSIVARGSVLLFGLMALLITVAAANVAALVLARAAGRHQEIGVRLAVGASRLRLARQLITETLVLAITGGALGWILASWVTRLLAARSATTFDYVSYAVDIRPDLNVLVYTGAAVLVTAALFGIAPVWYASGIDLVDVLKRSAPSGRRRGTSRTLRALVVCQIAVSTTLLVGCGLLVRTYINEQAVDPGVTTHNVVAAVIDLDQIDVNADEGRRMIDLLRSRVAAIPGVSAASVTRSGPLSGAGSDVRIWVDQRDRSSSSSLVGSEVVTSEHFEILGIPVVQGRLFRITEPDLPLIAIVNETMARRLWPDGSPVGRRFRLRGESGPIVEVIGVAKNVKYRSLIEPARAVFYRPFSQAYSPSVTLLVRAQVPPAQAVSAIRTAIRATNPDLAIQSLRTLDEQRDTMLRFRRQAAVSLSIVCGLGLLLSSVGLYGVVSYGVRERARELGIRQALGARAADLRRMVMYQGLRLTAIGLAIGIALALTVSGALRAIVFGVSVRDPLTIAAVSIVYALVSMVALYLPARWATSVSPAATLRNE